ncbi:hypothetical protein J3F83DRAFT_751216 [Trichoderma novae-zelandiae]
MLLMAAVRSGEPELVSLLIEHGAEVDIFHPNIHHFARTPLSQACFDGRLDMVSLLAVGTRGGHQLYGRQLGSASGVRPRLRRQRSGTIPAQRRKNRHP